MEVRAQVSVQLPGHNSMDHGELMEQWLCLVVKNN